VIKQNEVKSKNDEEDSKIASANKEDLKLVKNNILDKDFKKSTRINVIYSRVSNSKQKEDLTRQTEIINNYMLAKGIKPEIIFEEIASGMNEDRKEFNKLLKLVFENKIDTIYISYKDRLTRFGFDYFVNLLIY
jgi:predicted site-specific integrase-resolvase